MLEVSGLSYAYPDGREALRSVTLRVGEGERVAVLGPNGAGKSTLLLQLNGVLRGRGEVTVGGLVLADYSLMDVRAKVGLLFQDPSDQLFCTSVLDDVAFGPLQLGFPPEEAKQRAVAALASVGLEGFDWRSPHGLSAGEKKRVALATILSMQPEVLALDEPTAGLDPRARRELMELLEGLPQAMLCASQDLPFVRELFPRSVVLQDGRVVADEATAQLLDDAERLRSLGLA